MAKVKTKRDPLLHVTRRQDVTFKRKWITRIAAIIFGFIFCALISSAFGVSFGDFFVKGFDACFVNLRTGGISPNKLVSLLESAAILIMFALAVIPAFKMKFWNIGGEGQVAISILVCCILQKYIGGSMPIATSAAARFFYFIIIILFGVLAGAVWGLIPAIFKAKFKTNETLFTLMMNYVALILIAVVVAMWNSSGTGIEPFSEEYYFPTIAGHNEIINLIIIPIVVALVFVYLKFTKRGYEISVVGGSTNTARYIGLSVKKTIIRTMILSGAICGLCGALLVLGEHNQLSETITAGRGFTGVMIAWLGGFGPAEIVLYSFLGAFLIKGGSMINYNQSFPNLMLALFFFVLIACEFFIAYELHCDKLSHFMRDRFPGLFRKAEVNELEKPTNINDIQDGLPSDKKGGAL